MENTFSIVSLTEQGRKKIVCQNIFFDFRTSKIKNMLTCLVFSMCNFQLCFVLLHLTTKNWQTGACNLLLQKHSISSPLSVWPIERQGVSRVVIKRQPSFSKFLQKSPQSIIILYPVQMSNLQYQLIMRIFISDEKVSFCIQKLESVT